MVQDGVLGKRQSAWEKQEAERFHPSPWPGDCPLWAPGVGDKAQTWHVCRGGLQPQGPISPRDGVEVAGSGDCASRRRRWSAWPVSDSGRTGRVGASEQPCRLLMASDSVASVHHWRDRGQGWPFWYPWSNVCGAWCLPRSMPPPVPVVSRTDFQRAPGKGGWGWRGVLEIKYSTYLVLPLQPNTMFILAFSGLFPAVLINQGSIMGNTKITPHLLCRRM